MLHRCTFLFDLITSRRPAHTAWKLSVLPIGWTGVERLKVRQMCVRQWRQSGFDATSYIKKRSVLGTRAEVPRRVGTQSVSLSVSPKVSYSYNG